MKDLFFLVERTWTNSVVGSCDFNTNTNCKSMAYRSFQPEEYQALNARKCKPQLKNEAELLEVRRVEVFERQKLLELTANDSDYLDNCLLDMWKRHIHDCSTVSRCTRQTHHLDDFITNLRHWHIDNL